MNESTNEAVGREAGIERLQHRLSDLLQEVSTVLAALGRRERDLHAAQNGERISDVHEAQQDIVRVRDGLRDILPTLIVVANHSTFAETLLGEVIHEVAEAVGRLDGAAFLLPEEDSPLG